METDFDNLSMQDAINTGLCWQLEGAYGRAAMQSIEAGECMLGHDGHFDSYGNYVPSRYEVEPGTKGSHDIDRGPGIEYRLQFADGTKHDMEAAQVFGVFAKKHMIRFAPVTIIDSWKRSY